MKLSENFTLDEFLLSQTASRMGIDNIPSPEVVENLRNLTVNVIQPLRNKFGPVVISSGYRSVKLNSAVGGAKESQHLYGMAADINIPTLGNDKLAEYIRDNMVFDQCILEFYTLGHPSSGWVHVSYSTKTNRKECLTAVKQDGKTVYLKGIVK
jgi:zinc D-Ala-D-Ala carboxypeptidase